MRSVMYVYTKFMTSPYIVLIHVAFLPNFLADMQVRVVVY
jgi:hypothetical protein